MKRLLILGVCLAILFTFTGCNQVTVDGTKLSNLLIGSHASLIKFVVNNEYGDKITNIKEDEESLSFNLKGEIFYKEKSVKNNVGISARVEVLDKEEYYIDIANLFYYNDDRNKYDDFLSKLKDKNNKDINYKDKDGFKVTIERRNNMLYV